MAEANKLPEWMHDKKLTTHGHSSYWVEYSIFKSDAPPGEVSPELKEEYLKTHSKIGSVCFGGLPKAVQNSANGNRLIYHLEIDKSFYKCMTDEERVGWIRLLKQHKMLPSYVPENAVVAVPEVKKGDIYNTRMVVAEGFYLFDIADISQSMVYLYLTMVRNLREDYGIPIVTQFLVSKGMDFYAALGFGHRYGSGGPGHAMLSIAGGSYDYGTGRGSLAYAYQSGAHPESLISLNTLNGLARYMKNYKAYDKTALINGDYWRCYPIIDAINKSMKKIRIDIVDAFNEHIVKAIHAEDDIEYDKHIEAFMANLPGRSPAARETKAASNIHSDVGIPAQIGKVERADPKPGIVAVKANPFCVKAKPVINHRKKKVGRLGKERIQHAKNPWR